MEVRCGCGAGLFVLDDDVDAFHDHFSLSAQDTANRAFFAFVFAGNYTDKIA